MSRTEEGVITPLMSDNTIPANVNLPCVVDKKNFKKKFKKVVRIFARATSHWWQKKALKQLFECKPFIIKEL